MSVPVGWTADLSIALPPALTVEHVVDVILRAERDKLPRRATLAELVALGLSEDDAHLAVDRALGGIVRAAARHPSNAPARDKDPVAWASYERCMREPNLPESARPRFGK
jgi:hypothetical protein